MTKWPEFHNQRAIFCEQLPNVVRLGHFPGLDLVPVSVKQHSSLSSSMQLEREEWLWVQSRNGAVRKLNSLGFETNYSRNSSMSAMISSNLFISYP